MKAAVVTSFGSPLEIQERDIPEPAMGQVLIRLEACGLCHADIHAASGSRWGAWSFISKSLYEPAKATAESSASTWMQTITTDPHWVGLTLPCTIELRGSLAGSTSSPTPMRDLQVTNVEDELQGP